jgi:hypothetical protein
VSTETLIALLQVLHTAFFLAMSALVLYVLRCGIVGRASRRLLWLAIVMPVAVGASWWLNGRECLFATVIYALAGGDHSRADILCPDWFAVRIMPVSSAIMLGGLLLVAWRTLTRRWQALRR